ncbi:hypothetical protein CCAX7_60510 [Capsulimonas corticalis]|uniref:Uncharacterized protein n=1 Tax=Capsulimonas corticalis TaxID=2219043 RepID=A0A402CW25_9BACT|nr:nuclease-related domain-containing protein [Capsulimonas corticalis]BDI34000.1 hypothetical protein CCAX7_60510 [Capsulimonas corticalis]
MILKDPDPSTATDALSKAGRRAEEQMAFYLRRAFAEAPDVLVFNDLRVERNGEIAQIDHLILHRWGMVIIESKSVTSRVKINEREEWSRYWDGRDRGMASPVLQAKRQADLLRRLLDDHAPDLVGKILGLLQVRFGAMPIDLLVAISDEGVIQRTKKNPLPEVMKADQISERVKQLVAQHRKDSSPLNFKSDTSYTLSVADVDRIRIFLLAKHKPGATNPEPVPVEAQAVEYSMPTTAVTVATPPTDMAAAASGHACRHCASADITVEYGRYGYYFKCGGCEGNTPIKVICSACGSKAKLRKSGPKFWADCGECDGSLLFFENRVG